MGTAHRARPQRLAEKLKRIREQFSLTYDELIVRLDCSSARLYRSSISRFEAGLREPPLQILLQYARLANVWVDALIDDRLDLPAKLPSKTKSAGVPKTEQNQD